MKEKKNKNTEQNRILIVEDSITQAERLKHFLEGEDFVVDFAENALKALEYLEHNIPSLIISDVIMEGMDGFELCHQLKKNPDLAHIPVMLLTALAEPQDIIRGLESGADNFLTKPYNKDNLISQIQYILANFKLRTLSKERSAEMPEMGLEIFFAGKKHIINSTQLQMLDLLFSTFDVFVQKNKALERINRELKEKNKKINALKGLVPICANCKKIRDDDGYWQQVENYLEVHSKADFNQSICPECVKKELLNKK